MNATLVVALALFGLFTFLAASFAGLSLMERLEEWMSR